MHNEQCYSPSGRYLGRDTGDRNFAADLRAHLDSSGLTEQEVAEEIRVKPIMLRKWLCAHARPQCPSEESWNDLRCLFSDLIRPSHFNRIFRHSAQKHPDVAGRCVRTASALYAACQVERTAKAAATAKAERAAAKAKRPRERLLIAAAILDHANKPKPAPPVDNRAIVIDPETGRAWLEGDEVEA